MLRITKKTFCLVTQRPNEEPGFSFLCVHVCVWTWGNLFSLFVGFTGISTKKDNALKPQAGYVPQELGVIPECNYIISTNKA